MPALTSSTEIQQIGTTDITVVRGDDDQFAITFYSGQTCRVVDWTGWTFAAKVRDAIDGTVWLSAVVTHDGTGGKVTVTWPKAQTALLVPGQTGVWDLQGTDSGGLIHTVRRGSALVIGDVT